MRVLLLLRGSAGCGKSTWIEQNGLKPYTLSSDDIRLMYCAPEMNAAGDTQISQHCDRAVWDTLFHILESRMARGEFTVIDACNSKTSELTRYRDLCAEYRYRIYCVDFTDIPIEETKRRNRMRPAYKQVPDEAIDKMYARFETQGIPSRITVIKPDELDTIWYKKSRVQYRKIHVIGDVHGCNTALQSYLSAHGGIKDDELYIFVGDYIDRGIENADTLEFLLSIYQKPNVMLLEGNHERRLWEWANDVVTDSVEFETQTVSDFRRAGIDKSEVRQLYRKFCQCAYFAYGDKTYFISHGGISKIPDNLTLMSTQQMIRGTGGYSESGAADAAFARYAEASGEYTVQIHGHRNASHEDVRINKYAYNLEGGVEFGGCLRCLQIDEYGEITVFETKNEIVSPRYVKNADDDKTCEQLDSDLGKIIIEMRKNSLIKESIFGDVSSFNFTKRAFYDKAWDDMTMRARGLYINVPKTKVVARAYEKFFNINERPETKLDVLMHTLSFPVRAYVKENGFLGIVSYNEEDDSLFITTKSAPNGSMAEILRDMLYKTVSGEILDEIKAFVKANDVSMVFECIDMEHDPHIIEYPESKLVLLDIIKNSMRFEKLPYEDVQKYAAAFHLPCKEFAYVIEDSQEFYDWYRMVLEEDYTYKGRRIEGFVIEDQRGMQVKLKLAYYNFWKFMRGLSYEILKCGSIDGKKTAALTTPLANHYYAWIQTQYNPETRLENPENICSLRRRFFASEDGAKFADKKGETT